MTTLNRPTDALRRNVGIDLLRGLAVLFVVLHHLGLRFPLKETVLAKWLPTYLWNPLIDNGYEAVFVFFVISGFLITSNSLQRWGSLNRIDIKAFYLRRFARIMPSLLLLVAILSAMHLLAVPHYIIFRQGQSLADVVLSALGMHLNWYEGKTGYLPGNWDVLWSLSIEEVFYLGFPIVCLLLPNRWALIFVLALLAASLPFTLSALDGNEIWQEKAYLPGMAAIATGVLSALLAQYGRSWQPLLRQRITQLCFWTGVAGLLVILFYGSAPWKPVHHSMMLVLTGASACLVLACYWQGIGRAHSHAIDEASKQLYQSPRGTAWLCTMGRQSYEIYLTHMFVIFATVDLVAWLNADRAYSFLWYAPAVLLSWLLGASFERWYSTPSDRLLLKQFAPKSNAR